jgi:hypothetical protein
LKLHVPSKTWQVKHFARQQPFAIGLGALSIAAGLLLNEWFFEEIFSRTVT